MLDLVVLIFLTLCRCEARSTATKMGNQVKTLSTGDQIQQENYGDSTTGGFHVFEFHKGSADTLMRVSLIAAILVLAYLWIRNRYKKARNTVTNNYPLMGEVARALTQLSDQQRIGPAYPMSIVRPADTGRHLDEDDEEDPPRRSYRSS